MTAWNDLNARVRGLSSHLLGRSLLELQSAGELAQLARALHDTDYAVELRSEEPSATELDRAIRRVAARRLAIIARHAGGRRLRVLTAVFEDEDRRSVIALLRGAAAGAPADERVGGLVPTPELPERALRELSRQPTTRAVAVLLTGWGNAYGSAVFAEAASAHADLLRLELAVNRTFARRALAGARRSRAVREYVQETVDVENACAALVLASAAGDTVAGDMFLPGGRALDATTFERAAAEPNAYAALATLAASVASAPLGPALRAAAVPSRLERAALHARIAAWLRRARIAPLGPAVVIAYLLRARAEAFDLRALAWSAALGLPARAVDLVSV